MDHNQATEVEIDVRGLKPIALQTHSLSIGYKESNKRILTVSQDLSLTLNAGEFVCLVGPNGVGKSTLLRTLCGLQPVIEGSVLISNKPLSKMAPREIAKNISVVLTGHVQLGTFRAFDVVALGRYPHTNWIGKLTQKDRLMIENALEQVQAGNIADKYYHELSDGERQKVMIARALAQGSDILLLDEPTAFLDLPRRAVIMKMLRDLAHDHNKAVLASTHDLDLALQSADLVWLMTNDGKIKEGSPEDLILSGHFENTFSSQGIQFDKQTGNFVFNPDSHKKVSIIGKSDQLEYVWTIRALKRAGFQIVAEAESPDVQVIVSKQGENLVWYLKRADIQLEFSSIYSLILALQE